MHLSAKAPVMAPLYRNSLFHSDVRAEVHQHVAQELTDHTLHWKPGVPDAAMCKGELKRLHVYTLQYGAEVEVRPRPFDDFVLIHTSLAGGVEIDCDGNRLSVREGRSAVLAPTKKIHMRWFPGTQQLIVRVPRSLLDEVGGAPDGKEHVPPGYLIPRALQNQWDLLMQCMLNLLSVSGQQILNGGWLDQFERNLISFVLGHQPCGADTRAGIALPGCSDRHTGSDMRSISARQMDALIEYIESRLCAPIALEDMARAAGASVRKLNVLCHRYHGVSPMELLRNMRLDAVRSRLLIDPGVRVTEIALSHGFGHMGRFAAYYAARFYELPSDTLKRDLQ